LNEKLTKGVFLFPPKQFTGKRLAMEDMHKLGTNRHWEWRGQLRQPEKRKTPERDRAFKV
jgi:hypothetical protein